MIAASSTLSARRIPTNLTSTASFTLKFTLAFNPSVRVHTAALLANTRLDRRWMHFRDFSAWFQSGIELVGANNTDNTLLVSSSPYTRDCFDRAVS